MKIHRGSINNPVSTMSGQTNSTECSCNVVSFVLLVKESVTVVNLKSMTLASYH